MSFRFHIAAARDVSLEAFRSVLSDGNWFEPKESNGWIWSTRRKLIDPDLFDSELKRLPGPVLRASVLDEDYWSFLLAEGGKSLLDVTIPVDAFHEKNHSRWLRKMERTYSENIAGFAREMFGLEQESIRDFHNLQLSAALPSILDRLCNRIESALEQMKSPLDRSLLTSLFSAQALESSQWSESVDHLAAFLKAAGLTGVFGSPDDEPIPRGESAFDPEMDVEAEIKDILDTEKADPFQIKCRHEFETSLSLCMIGEHIMISGPHLYRQFEPERLNNVLLTGFFEDYASALADSEFTLLGCLSCNILPYVGFWGFADPTREICCLLIATGFNATVDIVTRFHDGSHIRSVKTDQEEIEAVRKFSRDVKQEALDLIALHKDRIQDALETGLTPIRQDSIEETARSLDVVIQLRNNKIAVFDHLLRGDF